jgi:hypothetical protein
LIEDLHYSLDNALPRVKNVLITNDSAVDVAWFEAPVSTESSYFTFNAERYVRDMTTEGVWCEYQHPETGDTWLITNANEF